MDFEDIGRQFELAERDAIAAHIKDDASAHNAALNRMADAFFAMAQVARETALSYAWAKHTETFLVSQECLMQEHRQEIALAELNNNAARFSKIFFPAAEDKEAA